MLDDPLSDALDRAVALLPHVCRHAPTAAAALHSWAERLSPTGRPRDYFDGARAVMLVLPWWLEKRIRPSPDARFQERLVESTVHAYYFVRLVDDVMDENAADARALLPVAGMLHASFLRAYLGLFPDDPRFWDLFDRHWNATLEAAVREKTLTDVTAADFVAVVATKTSGVKIPLAAVCCRYGRLDLLEPWCAFHDRFACWLQMADDTFDWMADLRHGITTFFLSEARRRAGPGGSVSAWVARDGFAWAMAWLRDTMGDVRRLAAALDSPEVVRFLDYREAEVRQRELELVPLLRGAARVADAFEPVGD